MVTKDNLQKDTNIP